MLVVDGLDEARGEAFPIAEELLVRLAPYAAVMVSTRSAAARRDRRRRCWTCWRPVAVLDLDDPAAQRPRPRATCADYVARRLAGVDRGDGPGAVAGHWPAGRR